MAEIKATVQLTDVIRAVVKPLGLIKCTVAVQQPGGGGGAGTIDVYIDGVLNQSISSGNLNSEIIDIVI